MKNKKIIIIFSYYIFIIIIIISNLFINSLIKENKNMLIIRFSISENKTINSIYYNILDNNSNHISCEGHPIMARLNNLAWFIGHNKEKNIIGVLYNLSSNKIIKKSQTFIKGDSLHIAGLLNNSKNNKFYLFANYKNDFSYWISESNFSNIKFSKNIKIDKMGYSYPAVYEYNNSNIWLLYMNNNSEIARKIFNKNGEKLENKEIIYNLNFFPKYISINKLNKEYVIFIENESINNYDYYLNSSNGKEWNLQKLEYDKNIKFSDYRFTSFLRKNNLNIVATTIKDKLNKSHIAIYTGNSLKNLTFNKLLNHSDGITFSRIYNDLDDKIIITAQIYKKGVYNYKNIINFIIIIIIIISTIIFYKILNKNE